MGRLVQGGHLLVPETNECATQQLPDETAGNESQELEDSSSVEFCDARDNRHKSKISGGYISRQKLRRSDARRQSEKGYTGKPLPISDANPEDTKKKIIARRQRGGGRTGEALHRYAHATNKDKKLMEEFAGVPVACSRKVAKPRGKSASFNVLSAVAHFQQSGELPFHRYAPLFVDYKRYNTIPERFQVALDRIIHLQSLVESQVPQAVAVDIDAIVSRYRRTGELPVHTHAVLVALKPSRDARSYKRLMAILLNRAGVEKNPGPFDDMELFMPTASRAELEQAACKEKSTYLTRREATHKNGRCYCPHCRAHLVKVGGVFLHPELARAVDYKAPFATASDDLDDDSPPSDIMSSKEKIRQLKPVPPVGPTKSTATQSNQPLGNTGASCRFADEAAPCSPPPPVPLTSNSGGPNCARAPIVAPSSPLPVPAVPIGPVLSGYTPTLSQINKFAESSNARVISYDTNTIPWRGVDDRLVMHRNVAITPSAMKVNYITIVEKSEFRTCFFVTSLLYILFAISQIEFSNDKVGALWDFFRFVARCLAYTAPLKVFASLFAPGSAISAWSFGTWLFSTVVRWYPVLYYTVQRCTGIGLHFSRVSLAGSVLFFGSAALLSVFWTAHLIAYKKMPGSYNVFSNSLPPLLRALNMSTPRSITFVPHMLSCLMLEYSAGTNVDVVRTTVTQRLNRLATLPCLDTDVASFIQGTAELAIWLCSQQNFVARPVASRGLAPLERLD